MIINSDVTSPMHNVDPRRPHVLACCREHSMLRSTMGGCTCLAGLRHRKAGGRRAISVVLGETHYAGATTATCSTAGTDIGGLNTSVWNAKDWESVSTSGHQERRAKVCDHNDDDDDNIFSPRLLYVHSTITNPSTLPANGNTLKRHFTRTIGSGIDPKTTTIAEQEESPSPTESDDTTVQGRYRVNVRIASQGP